MTGKLVARSLYSRSILFRGSKMDYRRNLDIPGEAYITYAMVMTFIPLFMNPTYKFILNIYSPKHNITGFIKWVTEEKPMWLGNIQQLQPVGYESSGSWLCLQFICSLPSWTLTFLFLPVPDSILLDCFTCYFICLNSVMSLL